MRALGPLFVLLLAAAPVAAQGILTVTVRDDAGAVVPQATVTLTMDGVTQRRTTTDSGRARFPVVAGTTVKVSARRLGFAPVTAAYLTPSEGSGQVDLAFGPATPVTLGTVDVTATRRTVSGIVVGQATQEPLANVRVWLDSGPGTRTGADGRFTIDLGDRTTAVLKLAARGFANGLRIERVPRDSSIALFVTLDSANTVGPARAIALFDAESRIAFRRAREAMIGGRELRATGAATLHDAINAAPSVRERGLRLDRDGYRVFLDGQTPLGVGLGSMTTEGVEFVETYTGAPPTTILYRPLLDNFPWDVLEDGRFRMYGSSPFDITYIVVWRR